MKDSQQLFQKIFHSSPAAMALSRLSDGRFLEANESFSKLTGYALSEVAGITTTEADIMADQKKREERIAALKQGDQLPGFEVEVIKKSGEIRNCIATVGIVTIQDEQYALSTLIDVTERRQAEEKTNQLAAIVQSSDSAIIGKNLDGIITSWNKGAEKIFGYTENEVIGKPISILVPPGHENEIRQILERIKAGEYIERYESVRRRKDGREIQMSLCISPVWDSQGQVFAVSTIGDDITERKQAEKQIIQMKRLYATLSHVNETILRVKDRADLYQAICKVAVKFGEFSLAWVGLLDDTSKQVISVAADGQDATQWPFQVVDIEEGALKDELVATAIRTSKVATSDDIRTDTRMQSLRDQLSEYDYHSSAVIPFRMRGGTIGVVNLISREVGLFKTESEVLLLEEMGGNISFALDTIENEMERKLAENKLRENSSMLELAMQSANMAWWEMDIASGNVTFNERKARMLGYLPDQFKHYSDFMALVHPEDSDKAMNAMQRHIGGISDKYEVEYRISTKSEGYKWFYDIGSIVQRDSKGIPLNATGLVIDITERKRAEEIALQNEWQMKALVTSLDDIVFEIDEQETYLNIWTSDERMLVQPKSQILGRRIVEVLGEEKSRPLIEAVKRVLASGKPENVEYPLEVVGGQRWFLARVSAILAHDDSPRTASMLVRDITERKQAEKQIQLQLRRISALNDIDRAIGSSFDMRLSLDILLNEVLAQLGVDAASILLLNPFNQTLEYIAGKGFRTLNIRRSSLRLGEGLSGQVGLERKVLHIPNLDEIGNQFQRRELLKDEKFLEYFGIPLIAKGMVKGVLEVFHRTPLTPDLEWLNYLETLGGQAAIAIDNVQMFEGVQQSNLELITAYDATITGWSRAMDMRDKETEGHTQRVTELTVQLAKKMGIHQQEIVQMRRGALLHDIGKLGVPDNILLKPDKLSTFEWAIMRQHPSYAYKMLLPITYLRPALDIPYCHHERWDGTGYPRELSGEQIPLAARIFAIVDVWDALRSDRPYRASWTIEKTREHIVEQSGKHFDPQVVEAFLSLLDESPAPR